MSCSLVSSVILSSAGVSSPVAGVSFSEVAGVTPLSIVTSSWSHASRMRSRAAGSRMNLRNIWSAFGITRNGGQAEPVMRTRNSRVFCRSSVSFRFSNRLNSFRFCSFTLLLMMLMSWLSFTPVASLRFMICFFSSLI